MNQDLLAQLNDIQTPDPIGLWPLAWGWWLLIAIVMTLLMMMFIVTKKRIQFLKAKKQALNLLKACEQQPPLEKVSNVNQLLKRSALAYLPRHQVAKLSGDEWANWLNQHNNKAQISAELLNLHYQGKCSEEQANLYYQQAKQWMNKVLPIKKHTIKNNLSKKNTSKVSLNEPKGDNQDV